MNRNNSLHREKEQRVYSQTTILVIGPAEAQIIESSLKGEGLSDYRWLLLSVASSMLENKQVAITLSGYDLWFLRDKINPTIKVGQTTGLKLLLQIYIQLNELWAGEKQGWYDRAAHEIKMPDIREEVTTDASGSPSENNTASSPTDNAGG